MTFELNQVDSGVERRKFEPMDFRQFVILRVTLFAFHCFILPFLSTDWPPQEECSSKLQALVSKSV